MEIPQPEVIERQRLRYAHDRCGEEHFGLPPEHALYECCDLCNYARHRCHFCGDDISHDLSGVHPECVEDHR